MASLHCKGNPKEETLYPFSCPVGDSLSYSLQNLPSQLMFSLFHTGHSALEVLDHIPAPSWIVQGLRCLARTILRTSLLCWRGRHETSCMEIVLGIPSFQGKRYDKVRINCSLKTLYMAMEGPL